VDINFGEVLKKHKEWFYAIGIILVSLFYLGWAILGYSLGFVWTNLYVSFALFFLVAWCLAKKLHDRAYQKVLLAAFFICTIVCAGVLGKNALRSKMGEAFIASKGQRVLSNGWWRDENNKEYYFIHRRWNDSVFVNLEEKQFYKCLASDDSLRNCELINGILEQQAVG